MNEEQKTLTQAELTYWAGLGLISEATQKGNAAFANLGSKLVLQAADLGLTGAKRDAAKIYLEGWFGVTADREKGIALLRSAVADGCEEAEVALAEVLYKRRVPQTAEVLWEGATVLWRDRADYTCAHHLMSRAARMGHVPAMRDLAQMIREGIGCDKDPHLAAEIEWQADELSKK